MPRSRSLNLRDQTGTGVVLGTAGYMSPEQVRGEKADERSDIFSFGAVLYETLSGQRAFAGPSVADRASAILKEDPPDRAGDRKKYSGGPGPDRAALPGEGSGTTVSIGARSGIPPRNRFVGLGIKGSDSDTEKKSSPDWAGDRRSGYPGSGGRSRMVVPGTTASGAEAGIVSSAD